MSLSNMNSYTEINLLLFSWSSSSALKLKIERIIEYRIGYILFETE
jgi:hypothetical protein